MKRKKTLPPHLRPILEIDENVPECFEAEHLLEVENIEFDLMNLTGYRTENPLPRLYYCGEAVEGLIAIRREIPWIKKFIAMRRRMGTWVTGDEAVAITGLDRRVIFKNIEFGTLLLQKDPNTGRETINLDIVYEAIVLGGDQ